MQIIVKRDRIFSSLMGDMFEKRRLKDIALARDYFANDCEK